MADQKDQDQEKDFLDLDIDAALGDQAELEAVDAMRAAAAPAKAAEKTGPGVLLYDNKKYAVGLNWLIAEDEGDTELALKRAAGFNADFYCLRQNVVPQHGFGFLGMGHRIGMPVLASVVGDVLVGEWHGVFTADNGWWYVAVHADNIAPEGDLFFASEESAYNHFIKQGQAHRWPRAYAPESWNIQETSGEIPLSKLIGEAAAPALKPVTLDAIFSGKRNKNLAIGAGVVIIGLLGISLLGQQLLPSLVPTQAQLPVPNVQVSDILQVPPKQPIAIDETQADSLTSLSLVKPSAFTGQCLSGFSDITLSLPGWTLARLRCRETFVEGSWTRQIGSFATVKPYIERFPEGTGRTFADSSTFTATRRMVGKRQFEPPAELIDEPQAMVVLNSRLATLGDLVLRTVSPPASQELLANVDAMQQAGFSSLGGNKPNLKPLTRDDLPYVAISFKSKTPPNLLAKYFDLPGVVVQSIEGDIENGVWQYDAKLILKPDKRLVEANNKARTMQIR